MGLLNLVESWGFRSHKIIYTYYLVEGFTGAKLLKAGA